MPRNGELFPSESMSDAEIDRIIEDDERFFSLQPRGNLDSYVRMRRKLLGPVADITHPEFGRPNRPEENFSIIYRVREIIKQIEVTGFNGRKEYIEKPDYIIDEFITDMDGDFVDLGPDAYGE